MLLVALMFVDDIDLHIINSGSDRTEEIADEAQKLLDAWHFALRFKWEDLKLAKCYWTPQDYA